MNVKVKDACMSNNQIIVVGGGAAGMLAAVSARRLGADVTILEKNPRVGKKFGYRKRKM